eukprot:1479910-Rhodomonas_salina.1
MLPQPRNSNPLRLTPSPPPPPGPQARCQRSLRVRDSQSGQRAAEVRAEDRLSERVGGRYPSLMAVSASLCSMLYRLPIGCHASS